jgi:hypothetical protein
MSSKRNIGPRLAGVFVGVALLVFGLAAPALAASPTITSFTPTAGPVGCMVTITGTGFTSPDVNTVTFGADTGIPVDQTTVIVDSSTQVRAAVPAGALTGKLTVTSNVESAQSVGTFTVGGSCASPTITSFTPTFGPVGTSVTITGTNLTGATSVKFNGTTATITSNSATQIVTTVPAGATTGPISVTTANGTADSATNFTVGAASVPTITSFTPSSGPVGTSVTITGTNLIGATSVKFNGTTATITSNTATQIVTTVPAGATSGKITVTTPGGTATSATNFTVTGPSHDRSISLRLRDTLVARGRVTVSDGFTACADTVPVKIQKKVSGHWKTVKNTTTSSTGAYRIHLRNRHGRYRSLAPRVTQGADVCRRAVSPTQTH